MKATFGINTGLGFSIRNTCWKQRYSYNRPMEKSYVSDEAWWGPLTLLSGFGQISFGYQLGK
ncbi:MAG: hypothetical protein MK078_05265 [Crocinitomicaceae bacterium]|nr:hypothetical protein [Crocinitomicaceae bacterium]